MLRSLLLILIFVPASPAAWITYRNDTKAALVIQDVVTVNGKAVRGKPVKLAAGETFREFQAAAITKTIEVLEPGQNGKLLSSANVTVKDKDVALEIRNVNGAVKLVAEVKKK